MLVIDGEDIRSVSDFHGLFAGHPKVPGFYGRNLDALWDAVTGLVERPFSVLWFNAAASQAWLGPDFHKIVELLREAEREDVEKPWPESEKFRLHLLTGPLQLPSEPTL